MVSPSVGAFARRSSAIIRGYSSYKETPAEVGGCKIFSNQERMGTGVVGVKLSIVECGVV